MTQQQTNKTEVSAWAPFSHTSFTLLWTATLISNVGTWMHDVGAGWLMANLNPSPATVSLVQAATTLQNHQDLFQLETTFFVLSEP